MPNIRLLQFFDNGEYCLTEFPPHAKPFYGILSHRWGAAQDEISFKEVMDGEKRPIKEIDLGRLGFQKLKFCQERAVQDGLRYFWIDTCCINKQSSDELSYALNSMFYWYQQAVRCYVWMNDVSTSGEDAHIMDFEKSEWFRRCWTLQELLAPTSVVFYSRQGRRIGDRTSLAQRIHQATNIPTKALTGKMALSMFSVEEKFSWTKNRQTTLPEDRAYCLVGIFNVRMTPVYADGDREEQGYKAVNELKRLIKKNPLSPSHSIVTIGGACWNDLLAIDDSKLPELDEEIRGYASWLLKQGQQPISTENLLATSVGAGSKMRELLRKFDVQYNDDSDLHGRLTTWVEPWNRFLHHRSTFERVRGFMENRWLIGIGNEGCYTGVMAAKTLLNLILWRDLEDLL